MEDNKKVKVVVSECDSVHPEDDADMIGQKISECVKCLHTDKSYINLVKVHLADDSVRFEPLNKYCEWLVKLLNQGGAENTIVIPVGGNLPIKDITIERVEITNE